jgi:hypothetical protein
MIASLPAMSRVIAACAIAALVVSGFAPCAVPMRMSAMGLHDCCDPDRGDLLEPAPPGTPGLAAALPACCVVTARGQAPVAVPGAAPIGAPRADAVVGAVPLLSMSACAAIGATARDIRSRSGPPPPLRSSVLLI